MHNFSIITVMLSLLFVGQALSRGAPQPKPSPAPVKVEVPVIEDPGTIRYSLRVDASSARIKRIERLAGVVNKIINSEKFKKRVLGAYWNGKLQFQGTSYSNADVYKKIREGRELGTLVDYEWDLNIGIEKTWCSTLGWTYPDTAKFWFNSCNFDTRYDSGVAGTIAHEFTHKLGFDHDSNPTARRPYSVPYAVGTIVSELYNEFK